MPQPVNPFCFVRRIYSLFHIHVIRRLRVEAVDAPMMSVSVYALGLVRVDLRKTFGEDLRRAFRVAPPETMTQAWIARPCAAEPRHAGNRPSRDTKGVKSSRPGLRLGR